jgi:hypothetical protein
MAKLKIAIMQAFETVEEFWPTPPRVIPEKAGPSDFAQRAKCKVTGSWISPCDSGMTTKIIAFLMQ